MKTKRPSARRAPTPRRSDFGKPVDDFFAKHVGELKSILDVLRRLVEETAPHATATLKWGMPVYTVDGAMMCALTAHKAHVNLVLAGPPESFDDPKSLLTGEGETGRHLKVTSASTIPTTEVKRWLRTARGVADSKAQPAKTAKIDAKKRASSTKVAPKPRKRRTKKGGSASAT